MQCHVSSFHRYGLYLLLCAMLAFACAAARSAGASPKGMAAAPSITVSLADFGAAGDGVSNDSPALQAALDALAESAAGGDAMLLVPEGHFTLLTPVTKDFGRAIRSLTIVGPAPIPVPESEGPGRELGLSAEFVVKVGGEANALSLSGLPELLVRDITFIGDPSVNTDARVVLSLAEIDRAVIRHTEFYGLASVVQGGAILYAHHSNLFVEDSAFLGCATTTGYGTSVLQNTLWRGITVTGTRFVDYGNRPDFFSKTPIAVPLSWISIGNAAEADALSTWREVLVRDVLLDEGAYHAISCRPDLFAPYLGGGGAINLVHLDRLYVNISNLGTLGLDLRQAERILIERSHFGWSHYAQSAIYLSQVGAGVLDASECVENADTIRATSTVGRLDVVNTTYTTLDSQAEVTNVVNTAPEADPVQFVRARFLDALGREPDSPALFYWSNGILRCGSDEQCAADRRLNLDAYLNAAPAPSFRLSGRVTDEDGSPFVGVSVALAGTRSASAVTDANGEYSFANLPTSGAYTVTPSKTNYTFTDASARLVTPSADRTANFVGFIRRFSITGQVTNQGGAPLGGVTLTLSGSQSGEVMVASDGTYIFEGLAAGGTYTVTPSRPHYTFSYPSWTFSSLLANETAPRFTGTPVNYTLNGQVVGEDGAALSGVRVDLTGTSTGAAFTDSGGNYSFTVAAEGSYAVTPSLNNYSFLPASLSFPSLTANKRADFQGTRRQYTIAGTIAFGGSVPVSGVLVSLSGSATGEALTGGDGKFSFVVAGGGTYTVTPSKAGYNFTSYNSGQPSVTLNGLTSSYSANFDAAYKKYNIGGKVLNGAGAGISGVAVTLTGSQTASTATAADGSYLFSGVQATGNYTVTVSKQNYTFAVPSRSITNLLADYTADFTGALPLYRVGGRVTSAGTGLSGVTVALTGSQTGTTTTDANGDFSFNLTAEGSYTLTPSKAHYTFSAPSLTFNNLNSPQTANFVATLNRHTIGGRITKSDGSALQGVKLTLGGAQIATTTSDVNGNYSFSDLPAGGNYTLSASRANYVFSPPSVTVADLASNQTLNFTGTLNSYTLSGRVTADGGIALAGVTLSLSGSQTGTTMTDASGNYSFTVPAEGSYTLTPSKAHYTFSVPTLSFNNLSSPQTANFSATLNRHAIGGRITKSDGSALQGVKLTLGGAQTATTTTDASGNYSFSDLPAGGNYTVSASRANYVFSPPSLAVAELSSNQTLNFTGTLNNYTLSGRVTSAGTGLSGVTVALTGSQTGTTTTDASGSYSFTVPGEGSYTLTPSKAHYTFSTPARTFDNLSAPQTADFSATLNRHTISGRVTAQGGAPLGGATLTLSGSQSGQTTAAPDGSYSFVNLAGGGTYTITPSRPHYIFTTPSVTFSNLDGAQTANFTGAHKRYTLGGRITNADGVALAGVTLSLSGSQTGTATTSSEGNYLFDVEAEGNYTLTPTRTNYTFSPPVRSFTTLSGDQKADFSATLVRTVQLSATSYSVAEGAGSIEITVTRGGDLSGEVTVDYMGTDGSARQGSDISNVVGQLHFRAGEASRTFTIFLINDVRVEGAETLTVVLSNPTGATLGVLSATITITDDDTKSDAANPIEGAQFFVRQHYLDFFNREPDDAGLRFWSSQLTSCGTDGACLDVKKSNVSAAFFLSPEFQETGFYVVRAQRVAFGRRSDAEGNRVTFAQFIHDAWQVGEGYVDGQTGAAAVLEANKQAYAAQVVSTHEFTASFAESLTAIQYIDALFVSAGVTGTAQERQQAVDAFNSAGGGEAGRVAAFRKVTDSTSVRDAEFRTAFVMMQYFGYLKRDPDQSGFNFWLTKLNNHGGNYISAEMVKSFIISGEYRQRFGP